MASAKLGRKWQLKIKYRDGNYIAFAGMQQENMAHDNSAVNITDKGADGYRTLLENASRGVTLRLSGIAIRNNGLSILEQCVSTNTFADMQMVSADSILTGKFQVSNYTIDGNDRDAVRVSATFTSAGKYNYHHPMQLAGLTWTWPDANFTRPTPAWAWGTDGLLHEVPAGQPVFEHDPITGAPLGQRVESASTNTLLSNKDMTQLYSGPNYDILPAASIFENGTAAEFKNKNGHGVNSNYVASNGNLMTVSVIYETGTAPKQRVAIYDNIISAYAANFTFEPATETLTSISANNSGTQTPIADFVKLKAVGPNGGALYRVSVTADCAAGNYCAGYFYPAYPTDPQGENLFWHHFQFEEGSFPSSPIITTGTALTRAADNLSIPLGNWFNRTEGTLLFDMGPGEYLKNNNVPGYYGGFGLATDSGLRQDGILTFYSSADHEMRFLVNVVGPNLAVTSIISPDFTAGGKVALRYKANQQDASYQGTIYSPGKYLDITQALQNFTQIYFNPLINATIPKVYWYPKFMNDTDFKGLTA